METVARELAPGDTGGWRAVAVSSGHAMLAAAVAVVVGIMVASASEDHGYSRYRPWISEKLGLLRDRHLETNVFFLGASTTLTSIIPDKIDAAAAAAGCPGVRSINLAMPGARIYENAFMLDRLLEEPGLPRNSMVVYDVLSSAQFDFQKIASSDRGSVAVRLKYVPDVVAGTGGLNEGKHQVLAYIRAALGEQLGFHALNDVALGMVRTGDGHEELRRGERGYVPAEKAHTSKKRERFLRQLAKHEKKLRRWNMIALEGKPLPSDPFAAQIRAASLQPIPFAPPYPDASLAAAVVRAEQADPNLHGISITKDNAPAIFADGALWCDRLHVAEAGGQLVSDIVGRELCHIIKNS